MPLYIKLLGLSVQRSKPVEEETTSIHMCSIASASQRHASKREAVFFLRIQQGDTTGHRRRTVQQNSLSESSSREVKTPTLLTHYEILLSYCSRVLHIN
ncbi:hypothetical protein DY000_02004792 [Brassica cretica]|uniref:Uncharacterized protein n=1 Tax=Brassica cretica TaxID=69181 RepID=A0ABQ7CL82_BRACR|nr:hypothetical protein DY000_02004792 [Brassica cretica]